MAPEIPVDVDSLPTSYTPMDEALTYDGFIREAMLDVDKNEDSFLAINVEVTEPIDWRGKRVADNYIHIPGPIPRDADAGARRQIQERGVKLARFARSFSPPRPLNTDTMIGAKGKFTVRNEEYQGELRPKIANYII